MTGGGDPRFGGGATPPPIRERGSHGWIVFWGFALAALGVAYGVWEVHEHYAPDPIPWQDVGLASFPPMAVLIVGAGIAVAVAGVLVVLFRRRPGA